MISVHVGGKRPRNWGYGASGKTIVLGMIERDDDLTPAIVPAVKKRTLQLVLAMNVVLKPRVIRLRDYPTLPSWLSMVYNAGLSSLSCDIQIRPRGGEVSIAERPQPVAKARAKPRRLESPTFYHRPVGRRL